MPLPEFIPNHQLSYSDHEAVLAKILTVDPTDMSSNAPTCFQDDKFTLESQKTLQECINVCDESLSNLRSHKRCYLLMALTTFVILVYTLDLYPSFGWKAVYMILKVLLSGLTLFFVFMGTIWNSIEFNAIYSGKLAMEMALQSIALRLDDDTCSSRRESI